jgi:hypothetical protein
MKGALAPVLEKERERARLFVLDQARPARIGLVKVLRDRPAVGYGAPLVHDHRHRGRPGECDRIPLGEAPGNRLDREPLVRERHSDAPTVGGEAPVVSRRREVVQLDGHEWLRSGFCHAQDKSSRTRSRSMVIA